MAKKAKDEPVPTINNIPNRDIIQRLNFMYQASAFLQNLQNTPVDSHGFAPALSCKKTKKRRIDARKKTMKDLAQSYVRSMKIVGQRTTVKMDPSIKRTICRGCDITLFPGSTVSTRVEKLPSHGQAVVYTCLNCKTKRRIPAPPTSGPILVPALPTDVPQEAEGLGLIEDCALAKASGGLSTVPQRTIPTKRRKAVQLPRKPLLFARTDAGHVVFRGTERLIEREDLA